MKKIAFVFFIPFFVIGMDRQAIRSLYKDDQHEWLAPKLPQLPICGICLESEEKLNSLACHKTHTFCGECISKWRKQKETCPLCRAAIVDSVWCTCLKSLANPPVILALAAAGVSARKFIENTDAYLMLVTPTLENQCTMCASFAMSATCAVLLGATIYRCTHPKTD